MTALPTDAAVGPWASPAHFAMWATQGDEHPWEPYDWLQYLNRRLVDVAMGRTRFLLLEGPVRHGKSEASSKWFLAWYLGMFPDNRVLLAGHNDTFARKWGRDVRNILNEFGHVFGVKVADDSSAADNWSIEGRRGGMFTCGAGTAPTGRGFELIGLDDPVTDEEQAQSPTQRQKLWDWYRHDIRTRLNRGGAVMLTMARRHEDDLAGRIKQFAKDHADGDPWEVVHLPALAEPSKAEPDPLGRKWGEPLCPELMSLADLEKARVVQGARGWEALYQARPTTPEGEMFKVGWWRGFPDVPFETWWVRAWDLAASEDNGSNDPDWTAGVLMGRHADGRIFIGDARRVRATELQVQKLVRDTAIADLKQYGCQTVRMAQDPGQAGKALVGVYGRLLAGFDFVAKPERGDKVTRARPLAGEIERGNVFVVGLHRKSETEVDYRQPWIEEFVEEFRTFPHGGHDDWVDAAALAYRELSEIDQYTEGRAERTGLRGGR